MKQKKQLKWLIGAAAVLSLCFAFSSCPATDNGTTDKVITGLNLTQIIPAPVTGETPVFSYSGAQYSLAITWENGDGDALAGSDAVFAGGENYIAYAVVTANGGFTLNGLKTGSFSHSGAISRSFDPATATVTLAFYPTDIELIVSEFDLTDKIAAPETGVVPATTYNSTQYNLSVSWAVTNGAALGSGESFAPLTEYTATAVVTLSGYSWPEGNVTFTHSGAKTDGVTFDLAASTITVHFPATIIPPPNIISGPNPDGWEITVGQKVPVQLQAGRTYKMGIRHKGPSAEDENGASFELFLGIADPRPEAYDWFSDGNTIMLPGLNDWTDTAEDYICPGTNNYFFILLSTALSDPGPFSVAQMWLYDITDGPNTNNLLLNPDFAYASAIYLNPKGNHFGHTVMENHPGWVMREDWSISPAE
ncbi:MAG: hypothetical protein FWF29_00490 [Treponema sp.]|nr:hypothetical protein [Treponema sp.]